MPMKPDAKTAYREKNRARANAYSKAWYDQKPEVISQRARKLELRIFKAAYSALIMELCPPPRQTKDRSPYNPISHVSPEEKERRRVHRERVRNQRKTARKRAKVTGRLKTGDLMTLFDLQKGRCFYCVKKLPTDYHVDHFIPLIKGGTNERDNLRLACPKCNLAKRTMMPEEFLGVLVA